MVDNREDGMKARLLLAAAAAIALAAGTAAAQDTFKIGILTPSTGTYAKLGQQQTWSFEMAAEEINAGGGILGRKIEFVQEDSEANPKAATQKAEKLITVDKVNLIIGTVSSGVSLAVGEVAERFGANMITSVSWSDAITGAKCSPNAFRVNARAGQMANALAEWLGKNFSGKRIAYIGPDYEMGRSTVAAFKALAESRGLVSAGEIYAPLETPDYSPFFGQIRAANPDVLFAPMAGEDSVRFFTQLAEFGMQGQFQLTGGAGSITPAELPAIGDAANGFTFGAGYAASIDTPENKAFVEKYKARSDGQDPTLYAADAYGVLYLVEKAADKAGSLDPDAVQKAMRGMTWDTPQGMKTIREGDNQAVMTMYVVQISDGDFHVIDTIDGEAAIGPDECERW
jgi:branched-chain amino acid transport system substrate-binding protein